MRSLTMGMLVGAIAGIFVVGTVAAVFFAKQSRDAKVGWRLVPIVVVAEDIPENTALTFDMISQRSVPEQFVTDSMIQPSQSAGVIGEKVTAPHQAGDPLEWQSFAELGGNEEIANCVEAIAPLVDAEAERARAEAVKAFVQRASEAPTGGAAAPSAPAADPNGTVSIVSVRAEAREGTVLTEEMLITTAWPVSLVTASKVTAAERAAVIGRKLVAPMEAGDALQWQFLDDVETPGSALGCVARVEQALDEAVKQVAPREADAFFAREVKR